MYVDYFLQVIIYRERGYKCDKIFSQFITINAIYFYLFFGFLLMMGYAFVCPISFKSWKILFKETRNMLAPCPAL